jgi:hypothetical protein
MDNIIFVHGAVQLRRKARRNTSGAPAVRDCEHTHAAAFPQELRAICWHQHTHPPLAEEHLDAALYRWKIEAANGRL